jgi:uncharacterized RDD family membrane protein YckC
MNLDQPAGMGSRLAAGLVDFCALAVVWVASELAVLLVGSSARRAAWVLVHGYALTQEPVPDMPGSGIALLVAGLLVPMWAYYVIGEVFMGGRSVGKQVLGLRVVAVDGSRVRWTQSALRNLLRFVDALPGCYGVGVVTAFASPKMQRLGDIVARTLVVREGAPIAEGGSSAAPSAEQGSLLTGEELALLNGFWSRALTFAPDARARLAGEIATVMRARLGQPVGMDDESFLWALLRDTRVRPEPK